MLFQGLSLTADCLASGSPFEPLPRLRELRAQPGLGLLLHRRGQQVAGGKQGEGRGGGGGGQGEGGTGGETAAGARSGAGAAGVIKVQQAQADL